MPADVWYGADCELRIGRRADLATAPTTWQSIDFIQLTVTPNQEWRQRPKLGVPGSRNNVLDPTKPRKGFFRVGLEAVLDADSRSFPLWLRYSMGAPATTGSSAPYSHLFASGAKTEQYFDLAIKVGATDIRVFEGITLSQLSTQVAGENTQDFNINLSLVGLRRLPKATAFPTGTLTAAPAEAPMLRAMFEVDDVAADNMLTASFSYDRQLQEGIYLSATPTVSKNTPNGGNHSGSASFRAMGAAFDDMELADTTFEAAIQMNGVLTNHSIRFEHPQALLAPTPLGVNGPGMIERTLNWSPYQSSSAPAARITVKNDIASYASA